MHNLFYLDQMDGNYHQNNGFYIIAVHCGLDISLIHLYMPLHVLVVEQCCHLLLYLVRNLMV